MAHARAESAGGRTDVRRASGLNVLIGAWLLVAPFLLQTADRAHWNDLLVGIAVLLLSGLRFIAPRRTTRWLSWFSALAGVWLVFAPFVLGYPAQRAMWNDILSGILLVCSGLWSANHPRLSGRPR